MKFAFLLVSLFLPLAAHAAEFKKIEECAVGAKVADRKNKTGVITGISNGMCKVRLEGEQKEASYLHWMLRPAGSSAVTAGKIVFESGALKPASARLFNGPKIGLNMSGQNVYNTTCGMKKSK